MLIIRKSREAMIRLWADKGYRRGAEIGVWKGEFSARMCELIQGLQLICVDPWQQYKFYNDDKNNQERLDDAHRQTCERLGPFGCSIWRTESVEAAKLVPDSALDFVYIDGNHSEPYISQDLEAWVPKVRVGGMICGHDYVRRKKNPDLQVADAVDRFVTEYHIKDLTIWTGDKSPSFSWVVA